MFVRGNISRGLKCACEEGSGSYNSAIAKRRVCTGPRRMRDMCHRPGINTWPRATRSLDFQLTQMCEQ